MEKMALGKIPLLMPVKNDHKSLELILMLITILCGRLGCATFWSSDFLFSLYCYSFASPLCSPCRKAAWSPALKEMLADQTKGKDSFTHLVQYRVLNILTP